MILPDLLDTVRMFEWLCRTIVRHLTKGHGFQGSRRFRAFPPERIEDDEGNHLGKQRGSILGIR